MATNGCGLGYRGSKPSTAPLLNSYPYGTTEGTSHPRTAPMSSSGLPRENPNDLESRGEIRRPYSSNQDYRSLPEPLQHQSRDYGSSERFRSFPRTESEERSQSRSPRPSPHLSTGRGQHSMIDHHQRVTHGQYSQEESRTTGSSSYYSTQPRAHQLEVWSEAGASTIEPVPQTSKPKASDYTDDDVEDSIPRCPSGDVCSQATIENARYSIDSPPSSDHPNEDRHFAVEGDNFSVWCVFDGHNGSRTSGFASNYLLKLLHQNFWKHVVKRANSELICEALNGLFMDTEKEFFANMEKHIAQKKRLQGRIPSVSCGVHEGGL